MKKLIGSLAVFSLLGAAAPALASDIVEFRYSPSRERVQPATETAPAKPEGAAEPAKAPCACCAKAGGHAHAQQEKAST